MSVLLPILIIFLPVFVLFAIYKQTKFNPQNVSAMRILALCLLWTGLTYLTFLWNPASDIVMYFYKTSKIYANPAAQTMYVYLNMLWYPIMFLAYFLTTKVGLKLSFSDAAITSVFSMIVVTVVLGILSPFIFFQ